MKRYDTPLGYMDESPNDGEYIERDELIAALKSANFRVNYKFEGAEIITKKDLLDILGIDKKELE